MISPLPPQKTGESSYTKRLIENLRSIGHDIRILAVSGPEASSLRNYGGRVEHVKIWNGRDLFYPVRVARVIKRWRPHLVHVQFGPHGAIYGGMFGEWMFLLLAIVRLMGIRTTVTLHSTWMLRQVIERVSEYRWIRRFAPLAVPFFKLYMRILDLTTDTIQLSTTTLNSRLRQTFLREYGVEPCKVLEIPHACENQLPVIEQNEALDRLSLGGRAVILIFGFIRRDKDIGLAIRAMQLVVKSHPDALLLVGGTPLDRAGQAYLSEIQQLVRASQLTSHVRFDTYFISEEMVPIYFSAASVILLPYAESVGASGPMHNYAAFGRPIVASNAGLHAREALGGNVILFRNGDHEALAERLVMLLDDPNKARALGNNIRNYALREGWNVAASRTWTNYINTLRV